MKMIGLEAVPWASILLPRLTASHDGPLLPTTMAPAAMVRVTLVSAVSWPPVSVKPFAAVQPAVVLVRGAPVVGAANRRRSRRRRGR